MASRIQRIGRAKVRSHPACIFVAEEACTLVLYVPSKKMDGDGGATDSPEIVISIDEPPAIPYGDEWAPILPFDKGFPVYLDEGQRVFAVSVGESDVAFSAVPAPIAVVGY